MFRWPVSWGSDGSSDSSASRNEIRPTYKIPALVRDRRVK